MTASLKQTKAGRTSAIRLVRVLAGVGLMAALASVPAFASDHKGEESSEDHGHGSAQSESKFYGIVQKIPADRIGSWTVNGREIKVTSATRIREEYGTAVIGAYIEVEGSNTGKVFTAAKIEVKRAKK
jgi:hypothetical protein